MASTCQKKTTHTWGENGHQQVSETSTPHRLYATTENARSEQRKGFFGGEKENERRANFSRGNKKKRGAGISHGIEKNRKKNGAPTCYGG